MNHLFKEKRGIENSFFSYAPVIDYRQERRRTSSNYRMRVRASKLCKDRSDITQREKRTKTGCLTCRKRRKKCTEEKPRCFKCVANNLECKWPDTIILNNKLSVLKYKEKTSRIAKAINTKKAPDELKDYSTNSESKTSVDENLLFHLCVDLFLPNLLTQDLNSLCEEGNSYIVQQTQKTQSLKRHFSVVVQPT